MLRLARDEYKTFARKNYRKLWLVCINLRY